MNYALDQSSNYNLTSLGTTIEDFFEFLIRVNFSNIVQFFKC